jgi:hypothetical protein
MIGAADAEPREDAMRFRLWTALALVAAGCAGRSAETKPAAAEDPFFALKFADAAPSPTPAEPVGGVDAFSIEVSFERADGRVLAAPRITTQPGQCGAIAVSNVTSYIGDFDVEHHVAGSTVGDPVVKIVEDGLWLDACATLAADGGVTLGYRARLVKLRKPIPEFTTKLAADTTVTVQLPVTERVEFEGARWVQPGALAMLGRVSSPDGGGPLNVLVRVTPVRVEAPPGAATPTAVDPKLSRPMSGHTVHLRVAAVQVRREFEPGAVLDETAAPDVMKASGGRVLRDFELFTCLDSRVRIAGVEREELGSKERGLVVESGDDGVLRLSWTMGEATRTASLRPNVGRRFVALGKLEGGGTAGVIVSVDAD